MGGGGLIVPSAEAPLFGEFLSKILREGTDKPDKTQAGGHLSSTPLNIFYQADVIS